MQEMHHQTNRDRYGRGQDRDWNRLDLDPEQVSDASHREKQRIVCLGWKFEEEEE